MQVFLKIRFNRGPTDRHVDTEDLEGGADVEPEEFEDEGPNELHITVVAARGILIHSFFLFSIVS